MAAEETEILDVSVGFRVGSDGLTLHPRGGVAITVFTRDELLDKLVEQSIPGLRADLADLLDRLDAKKKA